MTFRRIDISTRNNFVQAQTQNVYLIISIVNYEAIMYLTQDVNSVKKYFLTVFSIFLFFYLSEQDCHTILLRSDGIYFFQISVLRYFPKLPSTIRLKMSLLFLKRQLCCSFPSRNDVGSSFQLFNVDFSKATCTHQLNSVIKFLKVNFMLLLINIKNYMKINF